MTTVEGTNILSGTTANTYAGITRVDAGTLVLKKSASVRSVPGDLVVGDGSGNDVVKLENNNQIALTADVFIQSGGSGTVGFPTANGAITPGASPGKLNSSNVTFGASSSLAVELNGYSVGIGYDQLNTAGTVNLTGAALSPVTVGFLPNEGDQFVILNNDSTDPVTNTFDGLAEGAVVSDSTGKFFRVSYLGGGGNDVVLTMTNRSLEAGDAVVWSGNDNGAISRRGLSRAARRPSRRPGTAR